MPSSTTYHFRNSNGQLGGWSEGKLFTISGGIVRASATVSEIKITYTPTFLEFVRALTADRRDNTRAWGRDTIQGFLEAASSWAEDSEFGARQGFAAASPWKKFAVFLYCGKIYE